MAGEIARVAGVDPFGWIGAVFPSWTLFMTAGAQPIGGGQAAARPQLGQAT
jgi:hypothetical protein